MKLALPWTGNVEGRGAGRGFLSVLRDPGSLRRIALREIK